MSNNRQEAAVILPAALFIAILYAVCFSGVDVYPQISFTLFSTVLAGLLWYVLTRLGILVNKKAAWWLAPVAVLSLFNGIFDLNLFTYGNVFFMHLLIAAFVLQAVEPCLLPWGVRFFKSIALTLISNISLTISEIGLFFNGEKKQNFLKHSGKVVIGIIIAVPILLITGLLLMSGDYVFRSIFKSSLGIIFDFNQRVISFVMSVIVVFIYAGGYVANAVKQSKPVVELEFNGLRADTVIGATVLIPLNLLFLAFSVVQFAFLFTGGYMKLPDGMVYSEYAREGFFQLLLVTFINFSVLIFFTGFLKGVRENRLLKILLVLLCVFTAVLIASSFYRMYLYMNSYGFTMLRMSVITFLVMEVFLISFTFIYFFRENWNLFKCYILTGLVFYILVNITGSNYFSTKLNIMRFYGSPTAVIDLQSVNSDSKALIQDLYQTPEFKNSEFVIYGEFIMHSNYHEKNIVNGDGPMLSYSSRDENLSFNSDENITHWQNWSLLKYISALKE